MLLHEFFRSIKPRSIVQQDMLIAAHARSEDMILVTNNVREFERVPDLVVENWVEEPLYVCGRAQPQSRTFRQKGISVYHGASSRNTHEKAKEAKKPAAIQNGRRFLNLEYLVFNLCEAFTPLSAP